MDVPIERLLRPASVDEALSFLASQPDATPIHGGTDLMVQLRDGRRKDRVLMDISRLPLSGIARHADGWIAIGAGTTMDVIAESHLIHDRSPGLAAAAGRVGAWPIQCRATLGGNLGNASPAADSVPPLLTNDAEIVLRSASAQRRIPVAEFFTGPGRSLRQRDELIVEVLLPPVTPNGAVFDRFAKVGSRSEQIISMVCVAMRVSLSSGLLSDARVAIGSAAPTALRAPQLEAWLEGRAPDQETRREAGKLVQEAISPIDDVRSPAWYRRMAVAGLVDRFIGEVADA